MPNSEMLFVNLDNYIRKPSAVTANASSMNPCGQCEKISSVWVSRCFLKFSIDNLIVLL